MAKFKEGQTVRVTRGEYNESFYGQITEVRSKKQFYKVEAKDDVGPFYIVVEEECLEPEDKPEESCPANEVQMACLVSSLKSLAFSIGGTHVAGWVEEAERAAKEGRVVKYE